MTRELGVLFEVKGTPTSLILFNDAILVPEVRFCAEMLWHVPGRRIASYGPIRTARLLAETAPSAATLDGTAQGNHSTETPPTLLFSRTSRKEVVDFW